MARLVILPNQGIIDGFKGTVDFYLWKGVPCARAWPRKPTKQRSAKVQQTWPAFSYAAKEWLNLTKIVQDAYIKLATNSGLTSREMQVRSYLTGLYRYPIP